MQQLRGSCTQRGSKQLSTFLFWLCDFTIVSLAAVQRKLQPERALSTWSTRCLPLPRTLELHDQAGILHSSPVPSLQRKVHYVDLRLDHSCLGGIPHSIMSFSSSRHSDSPSSICHHPQWYHLTIAYSLHPFCCECFGFGPTASILACPECTTQATNCFRWLWAFLLLY